MIGIITFHRAINYGAVLQTYGLQQTIKKLGYDCSVIDYRSNMVEKPYNPFSFHSLKSFEIYPRLLKRKRFVRFIKNKLYLTEKICSPTQLDGIENYYNKIITGSDQVWCKKCLEEDKTFFLSFVKDSTKKTSYAASIGNSEINDSQKEMYRKLIEDFQEVSVREKSAKQILNCVFPKKSISVNIDPTLMLSSNEWDEIREKNVEKKPYILVYTVLGQYKIFEEAHNLAKRTGLRIIYLNDEIKHRENGVTYRMAVSPEKFIGYFAEAKYVITNSFHGTAFSIIYKKPFIVEINAKGRKNIRSEELLVNLGLTDRFLGNITSTSIDKKIDWENVYKKIDEERSLSKEYLLKILH